MLENYLDYWSRETNPESGLRFEYEKQCLEAATNGTADIDALIRTEYGKEMTMNLLRKWQFAEDPEAGKEYLASFHVRKETIDNGDFYSRWCICLPDDVPNDSKEKYPCVLVNGFNIDGAEFEFGFYKLCAKERFLYMSFQNTNWDNVCGMIDEAAARFPIDTERVYITGYSYAGYQTSGAYMHCPWKFAACAPSGNDVFRPADNFLVPYTADELARLRHFVVPFMQMNGVCEASNFIPLNDWHIRSHWGNPKPPAGLPRQKRDPRGVQVLDPTINPIRRLPDGSIQNTPPSSMPAPPAGMDRHVWALTRLNTRLDLLRCAPRDMDRCISYLEDTSDELHHVMGFYGDREEIKTVLGLKHYCINIDNVDGINAFRYIGIENHQHMPPVTAAEFMWPFFKQFRRDRATGRIMQEEYIAK